MSSVTLNKKDLDRVRPIEGFPVGRDEDIIRLSNPPSYTICPNPFIDGLVRSNVQRDDEKLDSYHREPFAFDVSEGKGDPIYNAHSYHTKVPYKAIMRYVLHYTAPGDIVFDGFCGSGMTGVAAYMCGSPDAQFKKQVEDGHQDIHWGRRRAILSDLSPAATFIANCYNSSVDAAEFRREASRVLDEVENEYGWMYRTHHVVRGNSQIIEAANSGRTSATCRINYTVWSDVFICPECAREIVYWDTAVDKVHGKVNAEFKCSNCGASLAKRELERSWETLRDDVIGQATRQAKRIPVLIDYSSDRTEAGGSKMKHLRKQPDEEDYELLDNIEKTKIPYWYPIQAIPRGDKTADPFGVGITYIHQYYTPRNLRALAALRTHVLDSKFPIPLLAVFQSVCATLCSKLVRFNLGKRGNGSMSGTLYVPSLIAESNVFSVFRGKVDDFAKVFELTGTGSYISCQSNTDLSNIPPLSVDYVFTDPPFGGNLMYSELNLIWEAWLGVLTSSAKEAVINDSQCKGLSDYQRIMESCFKQNYRILKPGRWMTVEFHNSHNSVWIAIQEALMRAGFVVADVRTLDKQQGSFNQVSAVGGAVKQDLVISAYKPNGGLEQRFRLEAGTQEGVWDFIRQHLSHLPVSVEKNGRMEIIAERQGYLLFDRMVAFHVQRGISVPFSAASFYRWLSLNFPERDGMFFLPDQVSEYDRVKLSNEGVEQLSLFVHDERSAIIWLLQELQKPQTYQELQPKFLQRLLNKDVYEALPELSQILDENFLKNEKGEWFVPDPDKQSDIERLREKALLKEFNEYVSAKLKLKLFRLEALRAGFKKCWSERDYATIVNIGKRLPDPVLQEDSTLLMYFDNANTLVGD